MAGWMQGGVSDEDRLDLAGTGRVLRRTSHFVRPYRGRGVLAFVLLVGWTAAVLTGPVLVRRAIDDGMAVGDRAVVRESVVGYLVAAVVAYLCYRGGVYRLAQVGESLLRDLRNRVFATMLRQSLGFYDRTRAGVLVSRMTADIDSLADLVQYGLVMFISAALVLSMSLGLLLVMSWRLALLLLLVVPILVPASLRFRRDSNAAYLSIRDEIAGTLSSLQEGFSGVHVVQAFAREDVEAERFALANDRLYRSHLRSVRIAAWYLPIVDFSGVVATAATIGVGGWLVDRGTLTLGTVVAFVLVLSNLFEPVQQLSQLFNMVQSGTASLAKLYELLDTPSDVDEPADPVPLPPSGALEVSGVRFAYGADGPEILHGVDLTVAPGERLALVGPTGAGKSSLAKLMARLYDPTGGTVGFGGVDLRHAGGADLRNRIVVVPQEGYLFSGTVADNIRLARPDASDAEIADALDQIGAWERIAALPEGLATPVRERGSRLSAGERQLVSLARAALVDPAVLVLDEATSSLDPGTEMLVERAMEALMESRTVIVIAHRLTTSERSDRVGVVDGGRLIELGTHAELVGAGGAYAELYDAWTRGLSAT